MMPENLHVSNDKSENLFTSDFNTMHNIKTWSKICGMSNSTQSL